MQPHLAHLLPPVARLEDAHALLTLAIVLLAGTLFGGAAKRLRLPGVTGQILAGAILGGAGLALFDDDSLAELQPIKEFALGLMGVTVGAHLDVRRLRNAGKRLLYLILFEAALTPAIVFIALTLLPSVGFPLALLLAALALETAPATIVAIVKESRARGVFIKTLVAAVAINNMLCIVLFELARVVVKAQLGTAPDVSFVEGLLAPSMQLIGSLLLGGLVGAAMTALSERTARRDRVTTAALLAIFATYGLSILLGVSPLLACMVVGIVQANSASTRDRVLDTAFASFEPAILAVFFTLAGMHLSMDLVGRAGTIALLFFAARALGKVAAAGLAMRLAHATKKVRDNLGMSLLPQAGLSIGLVILVENDRGFAQHPDLVELFVGVVLSAVTLAEIGGPILTRIGISRSGEAGRNRTRLIDFLQEENILTGLRGRTKQEVIEQLCDLLLSSHALRIDRQQFVDSVLEREAQVSTCLGGGLFVPHGSLPEGHPHMVGVMGLSAEGLPFQTPDGQPVHCVVLLATPPEQRARHLEVLATLARNVGTDAAFQKQLFSARSPAHACEVLHGEDTEGFNYFLEDEQGNGSAAPPRGPEPGAPGDEPRRTPDGSAARH